MPYKNPNSLEAKESAKKAREKYYAKNREKRIAQVREWELKNPERYRQNKKRSRQRHPETRVAEWQRYMEKHGDERRERRRERYKQDPSKDKKYAAAHRDQIRERMNEWAANNRPKIAQYAKTRQSRNKLAVIEAYGGECECCGEAEPLLLTIDHINGGGRMDRKGKGGSAFYAYLVRQKFPKAEYRLLCMNCNFALGIYGHCPHQTTKLSLP